MSQEAFYVFSLPESDIFNVFLGCFAKLILIMIIKKHSMNIIEESRKWVVKISGESTDSWSQG